MKLTPLAKAPATIYLLPFTHAGTKLALACTPEGGILRSQFQRADEDKATSLNRLSEACAKLWPQATLVPAPKAFQPDTATFYLYGTAFQQAVWKQLARLKPGSLVSYGQLAIQVGKPQAYRAVGTAVGANPFAPFIPCHRVLAANGRIGGFAGGLELKRRLLQAEGITIAA